MSTPTSHPYLSPKIPWIMLVRCESSGSQDMPPVPHQKLKFLISTLFFESHPPRPFFLCRPHLHLEVISASFHLPSGPSYTLMFLEAEHIAVS